MKGETFIMKQNPAEKTDLGRKLGPVMPLIAMFMTGTLIVSTFVWAPVAGLACAVAAVATGLPVYYMWEKQNRKAAWFRLDSDASPSVKFP